MLDIEKYQRALDRKCSERARLASERDQIQVRHKTLVEDLETLQAARGVFQEAGREIQHRVHTKISTVVTRCLETVFDDPYEFHMDFVSKRNQTEAVITLTRDGVRVDPMTAAGGGVNDVVSFALRVSCLLLTRPPLRRLLVLDEPFKYLSAEYRPHVRELIEGLAEDFGIQFVMVTHDPVFKIGKVVEIK